MSAAGSRLSQTLAFVRAHGAKAGLEVAVNFVLPFLVYSYASASLGPVGALLAASAPPILWSIGMFIRQRKIDAISMLVLSGIALSLLAFAGGGGVKFLQLRENLVTGIVGLVFLGSAAIGKPLIFYLARAGAQRRSSVGLEAVESLRRDPGFRRDATIATLVWGVGLVAVCAVNCVLVFMLTIKAFLLVSGPVGYAVIGLLTAWTFWFVPRALRQAWARRAATKPAAHDPV